MPRFRKLTTALVKRVEAAAKLHLFWYDINAIRKSKSLNDPTNNGRLFIYNGGPLVVGEVVSHCSMRKQPSSLCQLFSPQAIPLRSGVSMLRISKT